MTTSQDFEIIKNHFKSNNKKVVIHHCSQCEYPCGFYWIDNQLYFDSGCFCLEVKEKPQIRNDDDLKKFVKENPDWVKETFENEKITIS